MLKVESLDEIRGNNVIIYSLKTLLSNGNFPKFTILHGHMGVGKSTVARLVAEQLNKSFLGVQTFNFGLKVNMEELESDVFKLNPSEPRAFIFEEIHTLDKSQQTALLTMLDKQPKNVYIICTTTELSRILRTIRSRSQMFEFKLLGQRQLAQLLDDYFAMNNFTTLPMVKNTLLKSCYGIPRDLLKNADLVMSGDFTPSQLDELLGRVSEDVMFSLLCSLKSTSTDFELNVQMFLDGMNKDKLSQLRDFYTRFLLERKGIEGSTLGKEKITALSSLFNDEELMKIGRVLVRSNSETLGLDLILLNMELKGTGKKQSIGQQVDKLTTQQAKAVASIKDSEATQRINNARVTAKSIGTMQLKG